MTIAFIIWLLFFAEFPFIVEISLKHCFNRGAYLLPHILGITVRLNFWFFDNLSGENWSEKFQFVFFL